MEAGPASPGSTFDCLPDEVVVRILTIVGRFDELRSPGQQGTHVRYFLRATTCCKRWLSLRYQVKELDWTLETVPQAVALVNLLQHEQVSLTGLQLFATPTTKDLPLDLVFTDLVQTKVPAIVSVFCIQGDVPVAEGFRRGVDLTALVRCTLRCPHLTHLELCAEEFDAQEVSGLSPTELSGPLPALKLLEVRDLWWHIADLEGLVTRCSTLEHLEVSLPMGFADQFDRETHWNLKIVSDSLKSLHVVCDVVTVEAPRLSSLTCGVQNLHLSTPALTNLWLDASSLVMPDGLPQFPVLHKLQQLSLGNIGGRPGWFEDFLKPVMEAITVNQTLEVLNLSGSMDILTSEELQLISIKKLLLSLPPKLHTLGMEGAFLKLFGASRLRTLGSGHLHLRVLKAQIWDVGTGYNWLRLLAHNLPSLEKTEITCLEWLEYDVVEMIKKDFESVSGEFVLRRRLPTCNC